MPSIWSESNPADADAVPELDGWGPDIFVWSLADWLTWHRANVTAYGADTAREKFVAEWSKQTWGAGPITELSYDFTARTYLRNSGVLGALPPTLGGMIQDLTQGVSNAVSTLPQTGSLLSWIVPLGAVVLLLGYVAPSASKVRDVFRNPPRRRRRRSTR